MSTNTLSAPSASFEEAAAPAAQETPTQRKPTGTIAKDGANRGEIAREALGKMTLGELFRLALFPQDAKDLDTSETAWVLDIPVVAVQSRLR